MYAGTDAFYPTRRRKLKYSLVESPDHPTGVESYGARFGKRLWEGCLRLA